MSLTELRRPLNTICFSDFTKVRLSGINSISKLSAFFFGGGVLTFGIMPLDFFSVRIGTLSLV